MKKAIILTLIGLFTFSVVFAKSGNTVSKNSPMLNQGKYLVPQEKSPSVDNPNTGIDFKYNPPRSMNTTLVDSSSNGYGLVVSSTRPIDEDDDNWIITYRQYAGEGTTHGQLGAAFTDDIENYQFLLYNAYPNPFNPSTTIGYELPYAMSISLNVYDISGRLVRKLDNGFKNLGIHYVIWDGKDNFGNTVSNGLYVYRLDSDADISISNKIIIMK